MYRRSLAVVALALCLASHAAAAERWAGPALTPPAGLVLWLDAARQPAAWQAHGRPLPDGARLDVWYDASGQGLNLVQRVQSAQPRFHRSGEQAVVRFDGQDDALALARLNRTLSECSVFVVAAARSNAGMFRGFLAVNETGRNDYTSGFTIDMSGFPSTRFQLLNVEGRGFGGAVNLMKTERPFGAFPVLEVHARKEAKRVELLVDGIAQGQRPWQVAPLRMDEISVGARCYSNSAEPPFLSGFLDGDIAEVLLFERALPADEARRVRDYLTRKHAGLDRTFATPRAGKPLQSIANPPAVQMFVPGFRVREVSLGLPNINNVRYRPDGTLVALAYDGDVYLLRDTDGDGVEDRADRFWENRGRLRSPIGMALTPPGYARGDGLFVASKGKVSLIVDTDRDGMADQEIVVAQGWKELPHGVDALGVALDADGNIYFGLGAADFTNAYLVKDGTAHYDLRSERGTILKVSPDFARREIVATGIRFPVGLAFRNGDLFATDQEGATWLPNGNPFDELLHVQPGRHYGFPPRHPKHLPNVIDEPSVFDYGPQHQSTCGLFFNKPTFGPRWWADDALVAGYSRGKLYRTKLAKAPAGYVAQNQLLACLNRLTADVCVSPGGDLVVACHSGEPDWGSGPQGRGRLYKISYVDPSIPQPVVAWPAGLNEARIAFDRPLDPAQLQGLAKAVTIERGRYVAAGDRFESLRPGYAVVHQQLTAPRFELPVLSAQLAPDRRTLILATASHPEAVTYAVTLPGLGRPPASPLAKGEIRQHPAIDLAYDLSGVAATWTPSTGHDTWSGWLPHLDLDVARTFTVASAEHEALWPRLRQPGRLVLRTKLDPWQMLRPAVQPGSSLDDTLPPETVTLRLEAPGLVRVNQAAAVEKGTTRVAEIKVTPREGELMPLDVELITGPGKDRLLVSYSTNEDNRLRALPLRRLLVPWATLGGKEAVTVRSFPELEGGSWTRGRQVFFSDQAQCSKCHTVRGQGGKIGPDLSNLIHRDLASVRRDIEKPSAAINPDHVAYFIELKNGRSLTGTVRTEGGRLLVGDVGGQEAALDRSQIDSMTPSPISLMPEGLDKAIGPEKLRDLLTFLLTEPLTPAPLEIPGAPPPRRRSEVEAVLRTAPPSAPGGRRLHVVLAGGPKDHGPGEHDYPLFQRRWVNLLLLADGVLVDTSPGWPSAAQRARADVIVFYSNNPGWSAERAKELDAFLQRGGGVVFIHYAVDGHRDVEALAERIGLAWRGGASRFRHGPLELKAATPHPITRGLETLKLVDESYWALSGDPKRTTLLATGDEEGKPQPLVWVREHGPGRVFVSIPGHYTWSFDDPLFRLLLLRGLAWTAREPVDRFAPLATIGARISD